MELERREERWKEEGKRRDGRGGTEEEGWKRRNGIGGKEEEGWKRRDGRGGMETERDQECQEGRGRKRREDMSMCVYIQYLSTWEVCVRLRVAFTHSAARDSLGQRMEYQRHH